MSGRQHWPVIAALAVALLGPWTTKGWAQSAPLGDEAEQARLEKARAVTSQKRSTLERLIDKLDDDLLLDRILDPPRGIYVRLGGIGEGAGFGVGPAFRYNATRFDFKTSAAGIASRLLYRRSVLRFPGTIGHNEYIRPRGPYLELYGRRRDFPQEDFFGLGPDSHASRARILPCATASARLPRGSSRDRLEGRREPRIPRRRSIGSGTDSRMPSSTDVFSPGEMPGLAVQPSVQRHRAVHRVRDRRPRAQRSRRRTLSLRLDAVSGSRSRSVLLPPGELDVRHYIPFVNDTRTIAFRAWCGRSDPDAGQEVPFFLQPTLGGAEVFADFARSAFATAVPRCFRPNIAGESTSS